MVGRLFPTGRISIGRRPRDKKLLADIAYEANRGHYSYYQLRHWHYQQGLVTENKIREDRVETLGLSDVQIYHKSEMPKRKHGLNGITSHGRRQIEEGCYLLERRYGRRLGFYTLTCHYTEVTDVYEFNRCLPEIQRRYFQELKREYERRGMVFSYVSVYEIQPSRYRETGVPAIHIHYVCPCYLPGTWEFVFSADELRTLWDRVTATVCGVSKSTSAAIDATVVKRSASAYLSKYLSKGGGEIRFLGNISPSQIPSRWWSMSKKLRASIRAATVPLSTSICEHIMYDISIGRPSPIEFLYKRYIYVDIHQITTCVGFSGKLSYQSARSLRNYALISDACKDL